MAGLDSIVSQIEAAIGVDCSNYQTQSIGGGCINSAYKITTADQAFFVKLNQPEGVDMFAAEAQGLNEMTEANCVRVPEVITYGQADGHSFLALEYVQLGSMRGQAATLLGEQLAQMHDIEQPFFGWHVDNTIGSTPQFNQRSDDWLLFYQQQRLGPQLELAAQQGFGGALQRCGDKLQADMAHFFSGYTPQPALLHGDLWGGNASADENGNPVIYDPATYYGDREADIAMTELFGGFGGGFHDAYQSIYRLDSGYPVRKTLYNLYHVLNHLNMFGGGYLGQAEAMIAQLLSELRG